MSLDTAGTITRDGSTMCRARKANNGVFVSDGTAECHLAVTDQGNGISNLGAPQDPLSLNAVLTAFEALTNWNAEETQIVLDREPWNTHADALLASGIAVKLNETQLGVFPELFWQVPHLWLPDMQPAYPQSMVPGPNGQHPHRPPKPAGQMYHRYIPWLEQVFSLRALDPVLDLEIFHNWMNDDRVAAFFDEAGTIAKHQDYLAKMAADPHMMPVLGCLDGEPFCYFELYWACENRIGAHYDAQPWDRGWHVLVGDPTKRGADYITAWLPSLMHYMFLTEPRTQALVGEPATNHTQQLRNLTRSGFARIKDFDFPHKRATLVRLERDYFFKSRLWARPDPSDPGKPLQLSLSSSKKTGANA